MAAVTASKEVTAYIAKCPALQQPKLSELRSIINGSVKNCEECISYGMPAIRLVGGKVLVYFMPCVSHLGFYPTNAPVERLAKELRAFKTTKGSIHFPWSDPLPKALIQKICRMRRETESTALAEKIEIKRLSSKRGRKESVPAKKKVVQRKK
jgi:uncharacterized protein YdhG (YjbR/CyaY superfamily)